MTATRRGVSSQVPALTWDEIEIALGERRAELSDCIARLVRNDYIDSGMQPPSLWGRLLGKSETFYFWLTEAGSDYLQRGPGSVQSDVNVEVSRKTLIKDLSTVESLVRQLGYDLNRFGRACAIMSLKSGYSHAETASHLALTTFALDVKEADYDLMMLISLGSHARAMMEVLSEFKDAGLMPEDIYQTDVNTLYYLSRMGEQQLEWVERVLSHPVAGKERVAISRLDYKRTVEESD